MKLKFTIYNEKTGKEYMTCYDSRIAYHNLLTLQSRYGCDVKSKMEQE